MTTTKSQKVNFTAEWDHNTTFCSGVQGSPSSGGTTFVGTNFVTKGANYPDWKRRLANGQQCTTTMSGVRYRRKFNTVLFKASSVPKPGSGITCELVNYVAANSGKVRGANIPIGVGGANPTDPQKADNLAKTSFVSKLREAQTSFQGGVFIGEIGETLHMLRSPAKSLREGLVSYLGTLKKRRRQVKRVSPRKRLSTARKILADTWLEYSFGWKPFLSDIDDACKTLANHLHGNTELWKPVNAFGKDEIFGGTKTPIFGLSLLSVFVLSRDVSRSEVKYRGCVGMDGSRPVAWEHAGSFANDFIPTVWELIPYSFLVDYFTNIGDIISAASFFKTNARWMAKTTRDYTSSEVMDTGATPLASTFFERTASCARITEFRERIAIDRAPYTGSLVPTFRFDIPKSASKWINMAALASSQRSMVPFHR